VALRHAERLSLRAIARTLDDAAVPTVRGGVRWHPATVRGLLYSHSIDVQMQLKGQSA